MLNWTMLFMSIRWILQFTLINLFCGMAFVILLIIGGLLLEPINLVLKRIFYGKRENMNKKELRKVKLSDDDNKTVLNTLELLIDSLQTFCTYLKTDSCTQGDVKTYMFLAESYLTEIMLKVGYEDTLVEEYKERYEEIRRLNEKVHQLTKRQGKNISVESVTGALRRYENTFIAWYESEGFHFAADFEFYLGGIGCKLCSELNYGILNDRKTNHDISMKINDGWDIFQEKYRASLLDTDNNRQRIVELIKATFPNARIQGFEIRPNDYNEFTLSTKLYIPFSDLDKAYHLYAIDKKEK